MTDGELVAAVAEVLSRMDEAELTRWLQAATRNGPDAKGSLLGSALIRHLYEPADPLALVLRAHLYVEYLLDVILTRKLRHAHVLLKNRGFTFALKADVLRAANCLDPATYQDIRLLSALRNKFGHDLFFDIGTFDVSGFSRWGELGKVGVRLAAAGAKALLSTHVFQNAVMDLLFRLTKRHPFIGAVQRPGQGA